MNLLAIECTHESLSVALMSGGHVVEVCSNAWKQATETLVPLVDEVVRRQVLTPRALDALLISSGPGSFTALRIGMSVAKGIASGLLIPLVPVPTLPAMARACANEGDVIIPVIRSRKGEYHHAAYGATCLNALLWHPLVFRGPIEMVLQTVQSRQGRVVVVGRHIDEVRQAVTECGGYYVEAEAFSAQSLFPFMKVLQEQGQTQPLAEIKPDYRQMFGPAVGRL